MAIDATVVILPVTRRRFMRVVAASLPALCLTQFAAPALGAPPILALARGPGGVWGVSDQTSPDTAEFVRGPRGIFGLQLSRGAGPGLVRDERGVLAVGSSGV